MTGVTGKNKKAEEDVAADFISRPGMPIQKFRKDDVIIGATSPFEGSSSGSEKVEQLLQRLVSAVERGGVVNIDGNRVGDALIMGNYKTS